MRRISMISMVFIYLFLTTAAVAGDACTVTRSDTYLRYPGKTMELNLACTGDSGDGTVGDTTVPSATVFRYMGSQAFLFAIETVPGTGDEQPSAYTVTINNHTGAEIIALSARSTTDAQLEDASADLGFYMVMTGPLTVQIGNLGADNTASIKLIFIN